MATKVTILPNGPALVAGDFEVIGVDGKPIQVPGPQIALCRCGYSKVKPFCDGQHRPNGFKDPAPTA
ncbi:MAG: CDGSH iron-sulfur domain-containing protein [Planctomycetota bacterium]